jgi:hypothetical protein
MLNDARQIGAAIQQYCMEYAVTQVPALTYTKATGALSGNDAFTAYLRGVSKNYSTFPAGALPADATDSFILALPGAFGSTAKATFSGEGKLMLTQ